MKRVSIGITAFAITLAVGVGAAALGSPTAFAYDNEGRSQSNSSQVVNITVNTEQLQKMKADAQQRAAEAKTRLDAARSEAQKHRDAVKADVQDKLSEAKQRICDGRKQSISSILDRIGKRGDRHIEVVDQISERTQAFYKEQALSITNYDAIVADITVAKATADAAAQAVIDAQPDFSCSAGNPKLASDSYKALLQARADAVGAYRDSVKTLVTAVKAAAQAAEQTKESGMASPRKEVNV
jgi:Ulp1 family protease